MAFKYIKYRTIYSRNYRWQMSCIPKAIFPRHLNQLIKIRRENNSLVKGYDCLVQRGWISHLPKFFRDKLLPLIL